RFITTIEGIIRIPFIGNHSGRFDVCITALKNASVAREKASIAFIIRTQFRNEQMLKRAIVSTLAFAAETDNHTINTYVITDKDSSSYLNEFSTKINIINVIAPHNTDTRNILIREAIRSVSEDYILFLDDDDWVFPNEAQYVSMLLSCLPKIATLVV